MDPNDWIVTSDFIKTALAYNGIKLVFFLHVHPKLD